MQISKYFASLSIEVDKSSVKNVDKTLNHLEKKLKKLGSFGKKLFFSVENFAVDQKKLETALGYALDIASNKVTFEISRFSVNQRNLQATLATHMRGGIAGGAGGFGSTALTSAEWDRRQSVMGSAALLRHQRSVELANLRKQGRSNSSLVGGAAAGGGLIGRSPLGLMGPALALGLGGYGLSNLNQRNQEVVSAQLQSSAVVQQAGGTAQQGTQSFEYLRNEGQRIGFNYLDASGDYNKLISGLTGSGIGLKESQKVFSGFAELARVNKLDKTTQNRLFRALSQVAGKGKLQAEELTSQIAEALPGGTALFAQAYQSKIGGNKTGQEAIQQLMDDMKKGKVTSDILTYAGAAASQRANAGGALTSASTASQAEQARYQNSVSDLAVVASNAGVEEGFARIFRTLNGGLSESGGLVRTLSEGFNEATKWADDLLLFPQDFIRALEGRDSLIADWLGADKTKELQEDWKSLKQIFTDISTIKFDFLPDLQATSKEVAAILNAIGEFQRWREGNTGKPTDQKTISFEDIPEIDPFGLGSYKSPVGIFNAVVNNTGVNLNRAKERQQAIYNDPSSVYYQNPTDYDDNQKNMALDMANEQATATIASTNQFDISINIDPVTLANMDVKTQAEDLGNWFRGELERASVNFPQKE